MISLSKYKAIIFDFDGVILDSMSVRDEGFRAIFERFSREDVDLLLDYHNLHGGLSRFHKIKYFYNTILKRDISEEKILGYANLFSEFMRKELVNPDYQIEETVSFISEIAKYKRLHIASGSEQNELRYLCEKHEISNYFVTIYGSPVKKNDLVKRIIQENNYCVDEVALIGDSINDLEAAKVNNIDFYGYNNSAMNNSDGYYIDTFTEVF